MEWNSGMDYWSGTLDWTTGVPRPQISCILHRRRKEVPFGGGGGQNIIIIFGHAHLIEVQRSLVALEGVTAGWS